MTLTVLIIVAVTQFVFAVVLALFLFVHRAGAEHRAREEARGVAALALPMRRWLMEEGSLDDVCAVLDGLPPVAARAAALRLGRDTLNLEARATLAEALRGRPWLHSAFARASSLWWWRRLEAARLIADFGTAAQEGTVRRLLHDPHPAVRIAAANCLRRIANPALIEIVLNDLPRQPLVVRSAQLSLLCTQWQLAREALLARLTPHAPAMALPHWINVAEAIETPDVLAKTVPLHTHTSAPVRITVARAMKKYFHADGLRVLLVLIDDPDWRVRAQAARSLGVLRAVEAVPALARHLGDETWWMRFRSALALAQIGPAGRAALKAARTSPDQFAAQMAAMVSGLSEGSIVELVEG